MVEDSSQATPDPAAVAAAMAVLDRFMAALNARDQQALAATLHFPHHRLAGGRWTVWERPQDYTIEAFLARAGDGWARSAWDFRRVVAAGPAKVHLDVQFSRYRGDESVIGHFRSLWILACLDGAWGVLDEAGVTAPVHRFGLPKEFLAHASRAQVLESVGLTPEPIVERLRAHL